MLTTNESKLVVATLNKRRAWLHKAIDDSGLANDNRKEYLDTLKLLDSAIQKLERCNQTTPASRNPSVTATAAKTMEKALKEQAAKPKPINTARVLIAEDDKSSAQIMVDMLQNVGVKQADIAYDGREAFDKIKNAESPYDIILCDWEMPELNGIDVLGKARASHTLRGAHFIMVTGKTDVNRIKQAVSHGVDDYIAKPIDMKIVEKKIKAALGHAS